MKFKEERVIVSFDGEKILIQYPVFYRPSEKIAICEHCKQKWQGDEIEVFKKNHFVLYEDISESETREDFFVCECQNYITKKYSIYNVFLISDCIHLAKEDALRIFALEKEHHRKYRVEELTVTYNDYTVFEYPASKVTVYCQKCREDKIFVITHDKFCVIAGLVEGKTNYVSEELRKLVFEM